MYLDMNIPKVPRFISETAEAIHCEPRKDLLARLTENQQKAVIATISFYKKLHNLGYDTLRNVIPALEGGEVPVGTIDEVLRPGECFLFPEIAGAIETGYVETGRADPELATVFYENLDMAQKEYTKITIWMWLIDSPYQWDTFSRN